MIRTTSLGFGDRVKIVLSIDSAVVYYATEVGSDYYYYSFRAIGLLDSHDGGYSVRGEFSRR